MTKPASAPPVDALRGLLHMWRTCERNGEHVTQFDKGYEQASDECADALETVLNSLAASAQVRAVEAAVWKCGFCLRDYTLDALCCQKQRDYRGAAEPAPLAQDVSDALDRIDRDGDEHNVTTTIRMHLSDLLRQLAELQAKVQRDHHWITDLLAANAGLEASLAALQGDGTRISMPAEEYRALAACRADAERLDWLEGGDGERTSYLSIGGEWCAQDGPNIYSAKTLRAAIDAAIALREANNG
jgi:hypothetical protein